MTKSHTECDCDKDGRRVAYVGTKCSDRCYIQYANGDERDGYVPDVPGIGKGDYLDIEICLDCNRILGDVQGLAEPD